MVRRDASTATATPTGRRFAAPTIRARVRLGHLRCAVDIPCQSLFGGFGRHDFFTVRALECLVDDVEMAFAAGFGGPDFFGLREMKIVDSAYEIKFEEK